MTFCLSALWHGLYPGYIVSFVQWFIQIFINQKLYRLDHNYPKIIGKYRTMLGSKIYYCIVLFVINSVFNAGGAGFWLLTFSKNMKFLGNLYYITLIVQVAAFAFFSFTQFG